MTPHVPCFVPRRLLLAGLLLVLVCIDRGRLQCCTALCWQAAVCVLVWH
jgi:hypothetical protein